MAEYVFPRGWSKSVGFCEGGFFTHLLFLNKWDFANLHSLKCSYESGWAKDKVFSLPELFGLHGETWDLYSLDRGNKEGLWCIAHILSDVHCFGGVPGYCNGQPCLHQHGGWCAFPRAQVWACSHIKPISFLPCVICSSATHWSTPPQSPPPAAFLPLPFS